ncbi:type II toxin-antitoxin system RelE/ParE family toxin [Novosphingobium sp.]|uniref:type II toxin-antitoxin system RelE/ParE family toxin n=1 Tax=Novosphingobium sp. TaxID=1874826 RepID=UPI002B49D928|nr:type II toxin-antitoxin system RelE/ParE family toxin [Novosphingobium sp.]HKR92473.1 type II toxin-antitoxin system RelE/ParE family toxin [Novosphingobium sp.]
MIRRKVVLSPDALTDLSSLYDWIADQASPEVALAYVERLESYVMGFEVASERGTGHGHIRQGLRTTGFERRLTVAFEVTADQVTILGFFSGGRDWVAILGDRG